MNLMWSTDSLVRERVVLVALAVVFASTSPLAWADTRSNPYLSITNRNPFSIKPPAPVQSVETPPPVLPLAKVILTGVTSIIGPPRALLEITESEPGKAPTVSKRILKAGERDGSIEVLSIDVVNNSVRIRNGTIETNVVFEVARSSPTPAAPGPIPGPIATPGSAAPAPAPAVTSAAASPMIFSRGGTEAPGRANTGVASYGAEVTPTSGNAASSRNSYGNSGYQVASSVGTYGAGAPVRPLRGDALNERPLTLQENLANFANQATIANQTGGVIPHSNPSARLQQLYPNGWPVPPMPGMDDHSASAPAAR